MIEKEDDFGQIYFKTGNPFVDAGIFGIMAWTGKHEIDEIQRSDLETLVHDIPNLYITGKWNRHLMGMVLPNSKITNPSIKQKKEEILNSCHTSLKQ